MAQKTLSDVLAYVDEAQKKANEALKRHKQDTEEIFDYVLSTVYETRDGKYIDSFRAFARTLEENVNNDVLRLRVNGLISYLKAGEEYRVKQKTAPKNAANLF